MYKKNGDNFLPFLKNSVYPIRRQELETAYIRNGAIYVSSAELIFKYNKLIEQNPLAYIMPRERSINIDENIDLEFAEFFIKRNKKK
jgi:CMP-N-acetylneuraminic acid synthetase